MTSGKQCIEEQKVEDPTALAETLEELVARWDALSMMSNTKQERLENALTLAEEFESGVKEELKILKGIDTRLRSFGPVSDNVDGVNKQIEEMEVLKCIFRRKVLLKRCRFFLKIERIVKNFNERFIFFTDIASRSSDRGR